MKIQGIDKILVVDGTLASPAIAPASDPDNFFYRIGEDSWGLAAGGVLILTVRTTGIVAGAGLRIAIPSTGYFDFNGGTANSVASLHGADTAGMILRGNTSTSYATARDVTIQTLDITADAWRTAFTASGGAGLTNATIPVGVHGEAVAQAAHIGDPTGGATTDAEARTAINAILVVIENFGLNAKT